jgi:hypothetical protein
MKLRVQIFNNKIIPNVDDLRQIGSNLPAPKPSCPTHIQSPSNNTSQRSDVLLKFSADLRALNDQIVLLSPDSNRFKCASPSEREKLRNVSHSITFLLEKLNSYTQDFYDGFDCEGNDVDLSTFKHKCLTLLNDEECNILFNEPRGDWSVGRILGELIRSLKSLVFSDAKAPRFFTTTTQDKVNKLVDSVNELGISRP